MAVRGYEFYLLVLKVSLTRSLRSLEDKIRIPALLCNSSNFVKSAIFQKYARTHTKQSKNMA